MRIAEWKRDSRTGKSARMRFCAPNIDIAFIFPKSFSHADWVDSTGSFETFENFAKLFET
jgi:hypothetical protein